MALRLYLAQISGLINEVLFWHTAMPLFMYCLSLIYSTAVEVSHIDRDHVIFKQMPFTESLPTLDLDYNPDNQELEAEEVVQLVQCLPSIQEALGSVPNMALHGPGGTCM